MSKDKVGEILRVADSFNRQISRIIAIGMSKLDEVPVNIYVLQDEIKLAKSIDPCLIIDKCQNKIWDTRDQIINRNEDYFLKREYNEYIKPDENKPMIEAIIQMIKEGHHKLSMYERNQIWIHIGQMLADVIAYKQLHR